MVMMKRVHILAVAAAALLAPSAAFADETGGCESFAWPLTTEIGWMKAADSEAAASGAKMAAMPAKAIEFTLQPEESVTFPVAPTARKKSEGKPFAGTVDFPAVPAAGLYQITLASAGWIDLVQGGKALKPTAHTGKSDCDGARKSLRFYLEAAPFTVELSGIKKDKIKFSIRHAD